MSDYFPVRCQPTRWAVKAGRRWLRRSLLSPSCHLFFCTVRMHVLYHCLSLVNSNANGYIANDFGPAGARFVVDGISSNQLKVLDLSGSNCICSLQSNHSDFCTRFKCFVFVTGNRLGREGGRMVLDKLASMPSLLHISVHSAFAYYRSLRRLG